MDDKLIYYHVGQKIKKIRKIAHNTQEELAQAIGVSRASIANYESGKQAVSLSDLYKIADNFDVEISAFLPMKAIIKDKSTPEKHLNNDASLKQEERLEIQSFISNVLHKAVYDK